MDMVNAASGAFSITVTAWLAAPSLCMNYDLLLVAVGLVCLNNGVLRFYNHKKYRNFFHLVDDKLGHPLVSKKTNQEYCSWFSTFRREHP